MEQWKDIKNYEGIYQASNLGRVKRLYKNGKEKILTQRMQNGYMVVDLCIRGQRKNLKVHRLIAEAYIINPLGKPCVNHKNGIKTDNKIENLEWCTYSENIKHAYKTGLKITTIKQKEATSERKSKKTLQYDLQGNFIKEWKSATEAAMCLKTKQKNISACCRGERKISCGYKWIYKKEEL